jgi:hypothetical protein
VNQPQRPRSDKRRRPAAKRGQQGRSANDLWRTPPPLPDVKPIPLPNEVGAMLRSLGEPPMANSTTAAAYFGTVVERAAAVALALAVSADVLGRDDD